MAHDGHHEQDTDGNDQDMTNHGPLLATKHHRHEKKLSKIIEKDKTLGE
jgi:hypothetical protein